MSSYGFHSQLCIHGFQLRHDRRRGEVQLDLAPARRAHALRQRRVVQQALDALAHMDECCVVFSKGYSYQMQNIKEQSITRSSCGMLFRLKIRLRYSFEPNTHNWILLDQIKNAKHRAEALRRYPGSFAETLVVSTKRKKALK